MKKDNKNISSEQNCSEEQKKFASLCAEDETALPPESVGIGTYNEKRIHRIIKKFVCDDESCFEVKVGRYVADVLKDGHITEIQTAGFQSLTSKIGYYLESTDLHVTLIHPLIAQKRIVRADKESGELFYAKTSPKHQKPSDALPELLYVAEFIGNPRFEIKLFMISADEYRYSEKMRYRKKGAYDNDIILRELLSTELIDENAIRDLVTPSLRDGTHSASDFGKALGMSGRRLYRALACLVKLNILEKIPAGKRSYKYRYVK